VEGQAERKRNTLQRKTRNVSGGSSFLGAGYADGALLHPVMGYLRNNITSLERNT
jgi:fucose permease